MVERFNGRIEEGLQSHHFPSGEELKTTLHRYVWLYNQQQPTTPAISLGQQAALAYEEGLAQTQVGTVQETAILPSRM